MNRALRSGQFARLCRTTKDTLRHYEDIGLLMLAFTAENDYKNYLPDQAMDFMLISSLRDAGCSLADIKRFLEGGKDELREVMAERVEALSRQIAVLERKRDLLASSIERIDELETWRDEAGELISGSWRIQERPEAHCIETRLPLASGTRNLFKRSPRMAPSLRWATAGRGGTCRCPAPRPARWPRRRTRLSGSSAGG